MSEGVELAAPAPEPQEKPNSFARIGGVLFDPAATFASIVRRPDFLVPVLLIFIVSLIAGIVLGTHLDTAAMARDQLLSMPKSSQTSPDMLDKQSHMIGGFMKVTFFFSPVLSMLFLVIISAILFAAFKILGGQGEFLQALSITAYSYIPMLFKSMISLVALMARRSVTMATLKNPVASNIGYFINAKLHPMGAAFLSTFDVFTFWTLFLLIVGFATMSRFSRMKSAVIVIVLWSATVLMAVGGAAAQMITAGHK